MSKYLISALLLLGLVSLKTGVAGSEVESPKYLVDSTVYDSSLINNSPIEHGKFIETVVTAYSSRISETDSTPFITAAGTKVRSGVVAANWLPLGTKIKIPEVFGDKVFTVEDRMHKRNNNKLDVWFPNTEEALRFGVQKTQIEIL